uniref:Uncharacterized protein n=1 Tax=Arundo donax TaxID=35708 RepID=A0A0A9G1N4_ARUDO
MHFIVCQVVTPSIWKVTTHSVEDSGITLVWGWMQKCLTHFILKGRGILRSSRTS